VTYVCEDCRQPSTEPGYCVTCLLTHQAVSQVVTHGLEASGRPLESPRSESLEELDQRLQEAWAKVHSIMAKLKAMVDEYCCRCNRYIGQSVLEGGKAFRSKDGQTYCSDCFVANAKHACSTAGLSEGVE